MPTLLGLLPARTACCNWLPFFYHFQLQQLINAKLAPFKERQQNLSS
ncbi:hypothetical protein EV07_0448 [Prochlorococcus sp. MIT 0603]|nr:hypothetical protein EV07_0448 [Prochlorococcus sp. MIT 0603]